MRFNTLSLASIGISALALGLSAPAMAESPPENGDTTCAYCSADGIDATVLGHVVHGGILTGRFEGQGATGKVVGWKEGGGGVDTKITYAGNGCEVDCAAIEIDSTARGYEMGAIGVEASSAKPGETLTIANSGEFVSGASLGVIITRFGGWSPAAD